MKKYWKKFKVPFYAQYLFIKRMADMGYKVTKTKGGLFSSVYRVSGRSTDILYL